MNKKEKIGSASLQEKLTRKSRFKFRCHPELPCFTSCCRDVNIILTPWDVLRMRKRLGISSGEFLQRYTFSLVPEKSGMPIALLKMQEDRDRTCPFVGPKGCSIYEDRPWSCRMFPLDQGDYKGEFRFITDPTFCLGLQEDSDWTVLHYLQGQGLDVYKKPEELLSRISSNPRFAQASIQNPKVQEMCRMALYDLDRFRRFVLESRFLQIFYVPPETVKKISKDDTELLKLAHQWLEFGLVSGEGLKIRADLLKNAGVEEGPRS